MEKHELRRIVREAVGGTPSARPIYKIAADIADNWPNVNFAAAPYLEAMFSLNSINDEYGLDSGRSVVAYFLANAASFRGPEAKRIKAELKSMSKGARR